MTILNKGDQFSNDYILVPDNKVHFDNDVSSLVGHVFIKNNNKVPVKFNEDILKSLQKTDKQFKNEKAYKLTYSDLTKYKFDKEQGLVSWQIPEYEKGLDPAGCYIATTYPKHTYIKTKLRTASYFRYVESLVDVWSRQKNQPIIISLTDLNPNIENLVKRNYQTQFIDSKHDIGSNNRKFIDLLPFMFELYVTGYIRECSDYLNKLANAILNKGDILTDTLYRNQFIFSTLMFFEHLENNITKDMHLTKQIDSYTKAYYKATFKNLLTFIDETLTSMKSKDYANNLLAKYKIKADIDTDKITLFSLFTILKSNLADDRKYNDAYYAHLLLTMGSYKMLDQTLFNVNTLLRSFYFNNVWNSDQTLIVNPCDFVTGKRLILKFDNPKFHCNVMTMCDIDSHKWDDTVDINGQIKFNVDTFDLNNRLILKGEDGFTFALDLTDPNCVLPKGVHLISTNIKTNTDPVYLNLFPGLNMPYQKFIISTIYNGVTMLSFLNSAMQRPLRSIKFVFDFKKILYDFDKDMLLTWFTSGLGCKIQFTILDDGKLAKFISNDVIESNFYPIDMTNRNKFDVIQGKYNQFSKMPCNLHKLTLKKLNKINQSVHKMNIDAHNRVETLFEQLIAESKK